MSKNRDKELREIAISLKPYVNSAIEEARRAKASICVIGISTITYEEALSLRENLSLILDAPVIKDVVNSSFIPEQMVSQDYTWRKLKELLDEN